ncbi:MAG TPA: DNA polymerase III subunit chi, partial [Methylovirgula sp.]
ADASFLAHGRARDGDADMQPVYLTCAAENPNGARLRLFIDGADAAAHLAADAAYERAILLFDGNDSDQVGAARAQWKILKEQGVPITYWQQNERGGWEKKA